MKAIADKIRFIYLPCLLIFAGYVVAYSFLHWILILSGILAINEEVRHFWLPFVFAWISVLVWLRPRLRALKFKRSRFLFDFECVAVFIAAVPTIIAQSYLEASIGKLTELDRVSQVHSSPATKYYRLKDFFADRPQARLETSISYGTRSGAAERISMLFASPMRDSADDSIHSKSDVWLGTKYTETISSRGRDAVEEQCRKLIQDSVSKFNGENLQVFSYFERIGNNDDRRSFEAAVHKSNLYDPSKRLIILTGQHDPFDARSGHTLAWTLGVFGGGAVIWLVMLLFPRLDDAEIHRIKRGRPSGDNDFKEVLHLCLPRPGFYVTPIVMGLNVLVFLVMVFAGLGVASFQAVDLLNWGANYSQLVREGQWFRLVTSMFVHGGLMHLLANLYGLFFAGVLLEPMLGKTKFALAYFATGIAGSIASVLIHPNTVSVGASGAIFGLFGVLLTLLVIKDFGRTLIKDRLLINIAIFVGLNLFIGSFAIGIDNAAHLGGLLSGIVLGALLFPTLRLKAGGIQASE